MWFYLSDADMLAIAAAGTFKASGEAVENTYSVLADLAKRIEKQREEQKHLQPYRDAVKVNDELECDEDAIVSSGSDPGAFVMTWTWVADDEAGVETYSDEEWIRCAKRNGADVRQDLAGSWAVTCKGGQPTIWDSEAEAARFWCEDNGFEPQERDFDDNQPAEADAA